MKLQPRPDTPSSLGPRSRLGQGWLLACGGLLAIALVSGGCKRGSKESAAASASVQVVTPILLPGPANSVPPYVPRAFPPRVGPALGIFPGEGVGPIRLGATVATIERLMKRPCDVVTAEVCRYHPEAVEFSLTEGKVSEIRIHRAGRTAGQDAAGKPLSYGAFNGAMPKDPAAGRTEVTTFGLHEQGAKQGLGEPKRVEKLDGKNPFGTVALHHYDGFVLEYDMTDEAPMPVVGGFRLVPRNRK